MRFQTIFCGLALAWSATAAVLHPFSPDDYFEHPTRNLGWLPVKLRSKGGTKVEATVYNTDSEPYKALRPGTILDGQPVEKVRVFLNRKSEARSTFSIPNALSGTRIPFQGIHYMINTANLDDSAFTTLLPHTSTALEFDLAEMYDLSSGGEYIIDMVGSLLYAKGGHELSDGVSYRSNDLNITIDEHQAARARKRHLEAEFKPVACVGKQLKTVETALRNCVSLARAGQIAANETDRTEGYMIEYFKPLILRLGIVLLMSSPR